MRGCSKAGPSTHRVHSVPEPSKQHSAYTRVEKRNPEDEKSQLSETDLGGSTTSQMIELAEKDVKMCVINVLRVFNVTEKIRTRWANGGYKKDPSLLKRKT